MLTWAAPGRLRKTPHACHEAATAPALPDTHATAITSPAPPGSPGAPPAPRHSTAGKSCCTGSSPVSRCRLSPGLWWDTWLRRGRSSLLSGRWGPGSSAGACWGRMSAGRAGGPRLGSSWQRQRPRPPSSSSAPRAAAQAAGAAQTHRQLCRTCPTARQGPAGVMMVPPRHRALGAQAAIPAASGSAGVTFTPAPQEGGRRGVAAGDNPLPARGSAGSWGGSRTRGGSGPSQRAVLCFV